MAVLEKILDVLPLNEEKRRFQRVRVNLLGRYMLVDRREFPCQVLDMSPGGMARVAERQRELLERAAELVKPGGWIVYATCSLEPEEGPERVEALLRSGAPVERKPLQPDEIDAPADWITAEGDLRTLPCHWPQLGGLDGFYAARLRRR